MIKRESWERVAHALIHVSVRIVTLCYCRTAEDVVHEGVYRRSCCHFQGGFG